MARFPTKLESRCLASGLLRASMRRAMGYLTPDSKRALGEAVSAIERASSAEVVVVMRPASTPALTACALAAGASGLIGLAFLMFSPWPFSNEAIWIDTLLSGLVGAAVCRRFGAVRRAFTLRKLAASAIAQAAKAEFVDRGICETRERSGVLLYVSQIEHGAAVIADRGVTARVDAAAWKRAVDRIEESVRTHEDGVRLADRLRELAPVLASALPHRADDINELEDALVSP
ncbi:MAG TPA: hypothetical protein VHZ95_14415 [Polyangiales bacterium]|nr:hypothetical protein [Polyangiales bacterium]